MKIKVPVGQHQSVEIEPDLVVAGIDWGFGDPLAIEVGARFGKVWINIVEIYQPKMSIPDVLRSAIKLSKTYGIERFWADPEDPKMIQLLQSHNLVVIPNQIKDIDYGLRIMYGMMKMQIRHPVLGLGPRLRFSRTGCPNLARELTQYAYPSVKGEVLMAKPVDRHNHGIDTVRYYLSGEGELPPDEDTVSAYERPPMHVAEDGGWRDDPRATMAQATRAAIQAEGPLMWDEIESMESELIGGFDDE